MSIITERSPLIKQLEKKSGCEYLQEDVDEEEDVSKAHDPLLGAASKEDHVPNGGWGWVVTLAAFVIWVRPNRLKHKTFSPFLSHSCWNLFFFFFR